MKQALVLLAGVLVSTHSLLGQYDAAVRLIDRIPQHATDLPASAQSCRWFVGIPGLGSTAMHAENGVLYPGQILQNTSTGTVVDLDALRTLWRGTNRIGLDTQVELLHFGFRAGNAGFFTLSVRERLAVRADIPSDLLLLPLEGNAGGVAWGDAALRLDHFRETALGWQHTWGNRLRTGIRAKLLYGYEHADLHGFSGSWTTDPATWAWTFEGGGALRTSGLEAWNTSSPSPQSYLTGLRNRGVAFDLGVGTTLGTRTTVDAGWVDLGGMVWRNANRSWSVAPGAWQFAGLELGTIDPATASDDVGDTLEVWTEALVAQLEGQFPWVEEEKEFRAALPSRMTAAVRHRVIDRPKSRGTAVLTAMLETATYGPGNGAITVGWCHEFGNVLALAGTAGVLREGPPTAGAALALNLGPLQFHVAADNLLVLRTVELDVDQERIPVPASAAIHHVRFGLNLTFGGPFSRKARTSLGPLNGPPATTRRPAEAHLNPRPDTVPCALPGGKVGKRKR